jgi:sugar phosphate isomerase/epimerase
MKTNLTRKEFMKLSATAALALPTLDFSSYASAFDDTAANPYAAHPGLQLYTLRQAFSQDPSGTLKRVAEIGYKELEFFDPSTLSMAGQVKDLGMNIVSTHFLPGYITGEWDTTFIKTPPKEKLEDILELCAKNGVKNLGVGILFPSDHKTFDGFKSFAEKANKAGEKAKAAGVQLYYHNHSFEFEPIQNTTPLEAMLSVFDKELVKLELDVFWTTVSGNNAAEWITKLKGRIKFLHLKDLKKDTPKDYTTFQVKPEAFMALGEGMVDFMSILKAAHETGVPYTFVEQDHSAIDPFESITKSLAYLKKLGQ